MVNNRLCSIINIFGLAIGMAACSFILLWVQFAYRISIGWWIFVLTGVITILLTLLTVGWQAITAATANPVKSIKTE